MAAQGHQLQLARGHRAVRNIERLEGGLFAGVDPHAVAGGVAEVEAVFGLDLLVEVGKAGDDLGDFVADLGVIGRQGFPVGGVVVAQGRAGDAGDDGGLAFELVGRRRVAAAADMDHGHAVFDGDDLAAMGALIELGAAQAGQDQGVALGGHDGVAAVELGGHLHVELHPLQGGVGGG